MKSNLSWDEFPKSGQTLFYSTFATNTLQKIMLILTLDLNIKKMFTKQKTIQKSQNTNGQPKSLVMWKQWGEPSHC